MFLLIPLIFFSVCFYGNLFIEQFLPHNVHIWLDCDHSFIYLVLNVTVSQRSMHFLFRSIKALFLLHPTEATALSILPPSLTFLRKWEKFKTSYSATRHTLPFSSCLKEPNCKTYYSELVLINFSRIGGNDMQPLAGHTINVHPHCPHLQR